MSASPASIEDASQGTIFDANKVPQRMRKDGRLGGGGGSGLSHILSKHLLACPALAHLILTLNYGTTIILFSQMKTPRLRKLVTHSK